MNENTMLQVYALNKSGKVCYVDDVARGLACECLCPICHEPLVAKQGKVLEWHFAHYSGSDCDGAAESALHLAAKQVLIEGKGMMVPEAKVTVDHQLPDGREGSATVIRSEMWVDFMSIAAEVSFGDMRPDIVAYLPESMLFIEIAVTHFIDRDKAKKIEKMMIPTLEINISTLINERVDWQRLKGILVDELENKMWIEQLGGNSLEIEARELAMNEAVGKPLPRSELVNHKLPEFRFIVEGKRLYVREYPFGLTVWFQYDEAVLNIVKPIVRGLGGSYRKLYKNWLLPSESKEYLLERLSLVSNTPMEIIQK